MMTWLRGTPTTNMAISMEQAETLAQQYLDAKYARTTVGQVAACYGYYAMQVLKDGNPFGIMVVYVALGKSCFYSWMGTYMRKKVFS